MKESVLQLEICIEGLCLRGWDVQLLSTHSPPAHQIYLYHVAYCATIPSKQLEYYSFQMNAEQLEIPAWH